MLIFGITGSISNGKSTISASFASLLPDRSKRYSSSEIIASVANNLQRSTRGIPTTASIPSINNWLKALPAILSRTVHLSCAFSQITINEEDIARDPKQFAKLFSYLDMVKDDPRLIRREITDANIKSYRPLLQWLGGYLVLRVDPGIWYNEIIRRANRSQNQGTELCILDGLRFPNDAKLVKQAGGLIIQISRPDVLPSDIDDPTEQQRQLIQPDIDIRNDGSLDQLNNLAAIVLNDVKSGRYQKLYAAKMLAAKP